MWRSVGRNRVAKWRRNRNGKGGTKMAKRERDPPTSPRWVRMNAQVTIITLSKVMVFRGIEKIST
jgi:hypothetical protein